MTICYFCTTEFERTTAFVTLNLMIAVDIKSLKKRFYIQYFCHFSYHWIQFTKWKSMGIFLALQQKFVVIHFQMNYRSDFSKQKKLWCTEFVTFYLTIRTWQSPAADKTVFRLAPNWIQTISLQIHKRSKVKIEIPLCCYS